MKRSPSAKEKGIVAVEAIVGVTIAALVLLFVSHSIVRFVNTGRDSTEKTQALYLAEEGLEMVRFIRDKKWSYISDLTDGTTYYLDINATTIATSTTKEVIGEFARSFEISPVERDSNDDIVSSGTPDGDSKYVTVRIEWGTPTTTVSLVSILADINNP